MGRLDRDTAAEATVGYVAWMGRNVGSLLLLVAIWAPGSASGAGTSVRMPIYPRFFSHIEFLEDREASADAIVKQARLLSARGIPAEQNLHRGEVQAAWFAQHRPEVIELLRDPAIDLAYHPHPMRPYTDLIRRFADLPWDEAVVAFSEFERCEVDFSSGTMDCSRSGGLQRLEEVIGRPVTGVCNGGPDAIPGFVFGHQRGIPIRLGDGVDRAADPSQPKAEPLFGRETYAIWYMGQLVLRHPAGARTLMMDVSVATTTRMIEALDPTIPHIFGVLGSDKISAPGANEAADARYRQGVTLEQLRPGPDLLTPPGKVASYWSNLGPMLDYLQREVGRRPPSRFIRNADLPQLFVPAADTLSRAELKMLADMLAVDAPLPIELPVGDRTVSLADAWQGLSGALLIWQGIGALPDTVAVGGLLGPIGDPLLPGPPDPARRAPVLPLALLGQLKVGLKADRVSYELAGAPGQDPIFAAEQLRLFAELYRQVDAGGSPGPLTRPLAPPTLVPAGAPVKAPALRRRWGWYTAMQYWTAKRARWR